MKLTGESPTSTPRADLKLYSDPEGFYTIKYLPTWKTRMSGSEQKFCQPDGKVCLAVSIQIKAISADQLANQTSSLLKSKMADYKVTDRYTSSLGGLPATWMEHQYSEDNTKVSGFLAAATYNRVGLLVLGWAPETDYSKLKDEMQAVARTLHPIISPEVVPYESWKTLKKGGIIFHYLPGSAAEKEIETIASERVEAFFNIQKKLNLLKDTSASPDSALDGRIHFYLYPSLEVLYRSTARQSGFAINEASEVHSLWVSEKDHQTPGHELTHLVTYTAWRNSTQALMGEGLASCLDQDGRDYRRLGADLDTNGKRVPLAEMMGDAWFKQDPLVAYPESGSVACYLLETYGPEKIKALYQAQDFETNLPDIIGVSLEKLESDWLEWTK